MSEGRAWGQISRCLSAERVAAARELLFLVTRDITRKWTMPPHNWACILNQLAIRFEGRFPLS